MMYDTPGSESPEEALKREANSARRHAESLRQEAQELRARAALKEEVAQRSEARAAEFDAAAYRLVPVTVAHIDAIVPATFD